MESWVEGKKKKTVVEENETDGQRHKGRKKKTALPHKLIQSWLTSVFLQE